MLEDRICSKPKNWWFLCKNFILQKILFIIYPNRNFLYELRINNFLIWKQQSGWRWSKRRILTQLLVRYIGEAFAKKYIQYPFVATTIKQQKKKKRNIVQIKQKHAIWLLGTIRSILIQPWCQQPKYSYQKKLPEQTVKYRFWLSQLQRQQA